MIITQSLSTFASLASQLPDALAQRFQEGCCLTLGNYDGVHTGHQALLCLTCERAQRRSLPAVVVTFDPHPRQVLTPHAPPCLTTLNDRLALLEATGVDFVVLLQFTKELAAMSPDLFVRRILLEGLHMRELLLGHDFSMGKGRSGTPEVLATLGQSLGFSVDKLHALTVNGEVVSSSRIRELVRQGQVWEAASMLGRLHLVRGFVEQGRQRGRLMGFPTANLAPVDVLLPKVGVYASLATLPEPETSTLPPLLLGMAHPTAGVVFPAVTNIGHNPTFGPAGLTIETHLLDYEGDLYGQPLEVRFVERLRGEMSFSGPDALAAQIHKDITQARAILNNMLE